MFGSESGSTIAGDAHVRVAAELGAAILSMYSVWYRCTPSCSTESSPADDAAAQSRLGRS